MGIIGNNFRQNTGVHRSLGDVMARTPGNALWYSAFCNNRSQMGAEVVLAGTAIPSGGYAPATFYPPQEVSEMSWRPLGEGTLTASIVSGRLMGVALTGEGALNAFLSLSIGMVLGATGSGTLAADINGRANSEIAMTGSGDMTASMSALGNMLAALTGTGDLEAGIGAIGNMSIDITVSGTGLTVENVGAAVWGALSAANNDADTMGRLLNLAGSGGVDYDALKQAVWEAILADYDADPDSAAAIVQAIQTLADELHKIQGLDAANPMTVTPTTRVAGDIDLDITGDGETTTTVTRVP